MKTTFQKSDFSIKEMMLFREKNRPVYDCLISNGTITLKAGTPTGTSTGTKSKWEDFTPSELAAMQKKEPQRFATLLAVERHRISNKYSK